MTKKNIGAVDFGVIRSEMTYKRDEDVGDYRLVSFKTIWVQFVRFSTTGRAIVRLYGPKSRPNGEGTMHLM